MSTVAAILKHKGYQVSTVDPTALVSEIAQVLSEHRIGAVLVMDVAEQMLGIVSERDIVRSLAANGARTAGDDRRAVDDPHGAGGASGHHRRPGDAGHDERAFPPPSVMDHDTLIGLISIGDVVKARIMHQDTVVESLTALRPPGRCRVCEDVGGPEPRPAMTRLAELGRRSAGQSWGT